MDLYFWQKPILVCEFGPSAVRAAHLGWTSEGARLYGFAEGPPLGVEAGRFVKWSEAAEALWQVTRSAERSSGARVRSAALALDDPFLESVKVLGSAYLESASGEFEERHVGEAVSRAMQSLKPTDKQMIYQKAAGFLVDRKDYLTDPVGLCGKELTVVLHLLFSESAQAQALAHVARRAGIGVRSIRPAGVCAMEGALSDEDKKGRGVFIHAGARLMNLIKYERGTVQEYRSHFPVPGAYGPLEAQKAAEFIRRSGFTGTFAVRVSGDGAEAGWTRELEASSTEPLLASGGSGAPREFVEPRHCVLWGLFSRDTARGPRPPSLRTARDLWHDLRFRARAFVEEYF